MRTDYKYVMYNDNVQYALHACRRTSVKPSLARANGSLTYVYVYGSTAPLFFTFLQCVLSIGVKFSFKSWYALAEDAFGLCMYTCAISTIATAYHYYLRSECVSTAAIPCTAQPLVQQLVQYKAAQLYSTHRIDAVGSGADERIHQLRGRKRSQMDAPIAVRPAVEVPALRLINVRIRERVSCLRELSHCSSCSSNITAAALHVLCSTGKLTQLFAAAVSVIQRCSCSYCTASCITFAEIVSCAVCIPCSAMGRLRRYAAEKRREPQLEGGQAHHHSQKASMPHWPHAYC
eukprot:720-Heterococcus_DN1.PRE.4